jgi:hypothetical protein
MDRQEAPPDDDGLEQLALQQMNIIDIQIIAVIDYNDNHEQIEVPITPLVTDPFWNEFNNWRRNNHEDYDNWLNNRFNDTVPAGDTAPAPDNATNNATGDNAPRNRARNNVPANNVVDTDTSETQSSNGESSNYDSDTLAITSTGDSCITNFSSSSFRTGSTFIASSDDTFYTANSSSHSSDSFITCPEIPTPPQSLLSFCNEFNVSQCITSKDVTPRCKDLDYSQISPAETEDDPNAGSRPIHRTA